MAAGGSSTDVRIVLLGNREAGKSSAGNTILGREEFDPDVRTLQCVKRQGEVAGRQLTVVDTPGWEGYRDDLNEDSPNLLKQEIVLSVTLCPPGPHAFLLVIHENMTFTEAERDATSNHLNLLGHGAWKHSLVLFIQETPAEKKHFEVKGKMLKSLVRNCGGALLPELRIVLLGFKDAGKSSSGNTILGREEFQPGQRSAVCVKRQGEVAGRQVTVVEAPGWWSYYKVENSTEMTKRAIQLSPGLCDQGPHVFLLVIRADRSFTEDQRISAQQHLDLLSEKVWSHTIVLFTHGDWLGDTTIEQYIESERESLRWLVEKCCNRYHVVKNENRTDISQITDLLEKIEEMVAGNSSCHYQMDSKRLEEIQERMRKEDERAKERMMTVEKKRQHLQSLKQESTPLSQFRVVLLGHSTSGKNSSGNTILGREEFDLKRRTAQCVKRQGEVAGRQVTVVKAPGWYRYHNLKDTPELTKEKIVLSVSLCPPGPHVVLLVIDIDDSFTIEKRMNIQEHLELLGSVVWSHTMVLFTSGDWLGNTTIEQHIESEEALQCLVEKCGNRYHVISNKNRTGDQVSELLEKVEEMVAGNKNCPFQMDRQRLEEVKERRRNEEQRATERLMKMEKQRQHLQSLKRNSSPLSEFRVVLLGYRGSGKSSSGNTILGREEFDLNRRTAQCVKRQGEVAGRQVTVVKAPGWYRYHNLKDTPELTKQEIVLSVSLCPPGPHAVLLVIDIDESFTNKKRVNIQEHLELLGGVVWSHTMVLFTSGDWLGNTTIEQHIESEEALQCLVEKCGNRYHVISNKNRTGDQVTELLEKVEEMVAGNTNCLYEMDRQRLEKVKERRRNEEQRATERLMKVEKQRQHLQSLKGNSSPLSQFRVVLLGHRASGKSSSGNTILGRDEFDLKRRTAQCVKRQGEVAGRQVTVVKAPGWYRYHNLKDTHELTKQEIVLSVSQCHPGPHILLLLVQVADSYTQDDLRNIHEHLEFLSDRVWSHTMVLFTRGDWLGDTSIEQYIESEEHLRCLVEKCGNRYHVLNNEDKSDTTQISELMEKMEEVIAGNGGRHYEMNRKRLEEVKERRERATERLMKVERQRQHLQSLKAANSSLQSEFRVVLLGHSTSGKSSSGNTILGREEFDLKRTTCCPTCHRY
ncbi:GTPase IMAP family member 8-like [Sardina pilchardus]|uniref:GTPase IMAP family member 8-like n=1 Tax=Sardina pilchardus TaxID=27697 RepID=UPI002E135D22